MEAILVVNNLNIEGRCSESWYPIIQNVSFTLKKGEVLGLIGESGAGKSTIGLATLGYTRPGCRMTKGSIKLSGQELFGARDENLRKIRGAKIAYVSQSAAASFNPAHRLIRQYIEAPVHHSLMNYQEALKYAIQVYRRLSLPNPEKIGFHYPHELSGGQLQRAMIAMAMSCKPDIFVFDEPTTAIDVSTQIEVLAAVKEITEKMDRAAIYITHDLAVVAQVAHRILVLRDGKIVEDGETRSLLNNPKEKYTSKLLTVRSHRNTKHVSDQTDVILEVKDVFAAYSGKNNVLEGINLKLRKGKTMALVGESGSGKSTLARVITGLLTPTCGTMSFFRQPLSTSLAKRKKEDLRRIQMIYQTPDTSLNPKHTVRKVIGRPLQFYFGLKGRKAEASIKLLLRKIELDSDVYIDRLTTELSGGEKQRVCIARALAAKPDLIICDEVTSSLDQIIAGGILDLLQDLQNKTNISYLFITHDLAMVRKFADEIVILLNGGIVDQGKTAEVLFPSRREYTNRLLASIPEMNPDWLDKILKERSQEYNQPFKINQEN